MSADKIKFVKLPTGGRIEIELDEEQVQLFVKEEIKRQVGEYINKWIPISSIKDMIRDQSREIIKEALSYVIPSSLADDPREFAEKAIALWMESRQGWIAKQLRRGRDNQKYQGR
jgi:uncharacterized membrane-anchored protein YjiN (DUF445 family)